ncbi:MAG: hypothetical protein KDK91_13690, partial [Gammaproteobacteria bacterium]|nr:hypothetical protein [Gammaproteobacteria bacterium]
ADDLQGMFTERALAVAEQLAVSQQAVMSLQLIVQNNERLMSAMERALNVSVSALIVADRAAQAVSGRALGLGEISSVGRRAGAAAGLIGEQSPKSLEQAFAGALSALDSVHELRRSGAEQVEGVQRTLAG